MSVRRLLISAPTPRPKPTIRPLLAYQIGSMSERRSGVCAHLHVSAGGVCLKLNVNV